jgi:cell division protein FtsB
MCDFCCAYRTTVEVFIIKKVFLSFLLVFLITSSLIPSVLCASEDALSDDSQASLFSSETETEPEKATESEAKTLSGKLKEFSLTKMFSDVKHALSNMNFIKWYTYYTIGRAVDENGVEHTDIGWDAIHARLRQSGASFGEYCAQYSAVMTNWVYTMGGFAALLILFIRGNKKWYWYMFFAIVTIMSVTSVGMHTADYGEFARYTMTTKLLGSFVDMTFTELTVWAGVLCFTFEFYENRPKLKKQITTGVSIWTVIVILVLIFEVFVVNNRFLWIGGRGPDGLPYDMGGDHGGLSLAEFGCFITGLPLVYVLAANFLKIDKRERRLLTVLLSIFLISFIITIPWGDNEINSLAQGNFQGHSIWHMLNAVGTLVAAFWADMRTTAQKHKEEIEALKSENLALEDKLARLKV